MGHSAFKHVLGLVLVTSMLAASCCAFRSMILPEPLSMMGVQGLQEEGSSVPAGSDSCSGNCTDNANVITGALLVAQPPVEESVSAASSMYAKPRPPGQILPPNVKGGPFDSDLACSKKHNIKGGIFGDECWVGWIGKLKTPPYEHGVEKECMEYAHANRLLDTMFGGAKGNDFRLDDDITQNIPLELQPAGYSLGLTVDGLLMGYLTADLGAAAGQLSWCWSYGQSVYKDKAQAECAKILPQLEQHAEALGAMPGTTQFGYAGKPANCIGDPTKPGACKIVSAWMSFTVEVHTIRQFDMRRHFIVFSGEITPTGTMAEMVPVDVITQFPGLANMGIATFNAPKVWWKDGYLQMRNPIQQRLIDQQAAAVTAKPPRDFHVYVAGASRGSGMATYMYLQLRSLNIEPDGVYLFAAEKPGDQDLIKLYTKLDPYIPGLSNMRTHVWGNLEDAYTMYPPRLRTEALAVGNAQTKAWGPGAGDAFSDRDTASDPGVDKHGFHSLPPSYWWHLTGNHTGTYVAPTWDMDIPQRPPVYCLSGHMLAYRGGSKLLAAVDGFADTLTDKEAAYDWRLVAKWLCPWLKDAELDSQCTEAVLDCYYHLSFHDHMSTMSPLWTNAYAALYTALKDWPDKRSDQYVCPLLMMNCLMLCPYG